MTIAHSMTIWRQYRWRQQTTQNKVENSAVEKERHCDLKDVNVSVKSHASLKDDQAQPANAGARKQINATKTTNQEMENP